MIAPRLDKTVPSTGTLEAWHDWGMSLVNRVSQTMLLPQYDTQSVITKVQLFWGEILEHSLYCNNRKIKRKNRTKVDTKMDYLRHLDTRQVPQMSKFNEESGMDSECL